MKKTKMKTTVTREAVLTIEELTGIISEHFGIDMEKETVYIDFDIDGDSGFIDMDFDSITGIRIRATKGDKNNNQEDEED